MKFVERLVQAGEALKLKLSKCMADLPWDTSTVCNQPSSGSAPGPRLQSRLFDSFLSSQCIKADAEEK